VVVVGEGEDGEEDDEEEEEVEEVNGGEEGNVIPLGDTDISLESVIIFYILNFLFDERTKILKEMAENTHNDYQRTPTNVK